MAAGSLSIIPRRIQFGAAAGFTPASKPTTFPDLGEFVFAGLEVEGRSLAIETEESIIEDGQTTQIKYMLNWEFFIQGDDALLSSRTNKPSTAPYVKAQCVLYGAPGTLGLAVDDVYIWASPDYSGGKIRTKINMKKEFIIPPNVTGSPLITFTSA